VLLEEGHVDVQILNTKKMLRKFLTHIPMILGGLMVYLEIDIQVFVAKLVNIYLQS
jgi:hypothetical protein